MGQKTRKFGAIALIGFFGFLLGVVANFISSEVLPILANIFPRIFGATWIMWGIIGAFLAIISCLLYAYLP